MTPTHRGSFRLFRFAGIDLYLHWSWFVVAAFEINGRDRDYSSIGWNVVEYLSLFLLVLLHEYGHALACRQVGGMANQIVLWPLGGVAYVSPPPRPGATLWSIAAGPLVNLVLLPVLTLLGWLSGHLGWEMSMPNLHVFLKSIWFINALLLAFNLLPVYPLDGGQILRCLLWFAVGRARSLLIAASIGIGGVVLLIGLALWLQSIWLVVLAVFMLLNCWGGLMHARALSRAADAPRHAGFACPACRTAPPVGNYWRCGRCGKAFDTFHTAALCPHCGERFNATSCAECGSACAMDDWVVPATPPKL